MSDQAAVAEKKPRGRPFKPKGTDEWSDRARAVAAGEVAPKSGELDPTETQAWAAFCRDILRDKSVRAAMVKRWKSGSITNAELLLVVQAASRAEPEETDEKKTYREELVRMGRLSRPEQLFLYRLMRKMRGEEDVRVEAVGYRWQLVRTPGATGGPEPPPDPPVVMRDQTQIAQALNPDLPAVNPLAAASRRLALAERAGDRAPVDSSAGDAPPESPRGPEPRSPQAPGPERPAGRDPGGRRAPGEALRLRDGLRIREVGPRRPQSAEDREAGRTPLVTCGACGVGVPDERGALEGHLRAARNGLCGRRGATFSA